MEVVHFSEVLVNFYQATRRHVSGERHNQIRENLKPHKDALQPFSQLYALKVSLEK
jgi:hypothetical protein